MVFVPSTTVFVSNTEVFVSEALVWETNTMVAKPETIFRVTGKSVSGFKKIFSFEKTMVSGIESMFCVMQTIFMMTGTTVTAAKKMVSVAPTMICKVLTIGFLMVEKSFANPKLVFFELQPARIIINSGYSPSAPTDQHNSTVFALQNPVKLFLFIRFFHP
jgi:hypothetical protein